MSRDGRDGDEGRLSSKRAEHRLSRTNQMINRQLTESRPTLIGYRFI